MTEKLVKKYVGNISKKIANKLEQLTLSYWLLATTGNKDAAALYALINAEYVKLYASKSEYEQLLKFKNLDLKDKLLVRQIDLLILEYKTNMIPAELIDSISKLEAQISQKYSSFRPIYKEKGLTENEIKEVLKSEVDVEVRKNVWNCSKEVGNNLARDVKEIVRLRNLSAQSLGYKDYFEMMLFIQEIDKTWLLKFLEDLFEKTNNQFSALSSEINHQLSEKFGIKEEELGPWAWNDPFCQEDPLGKVDIDDLVKDLDFVKETKKFYMSMGIDCSPVLAKSSLFECEGKDQSAFCIQIKRGEDVRILTNIKQNIRWFDTVLHELGHAVYDLNYDSNLPWSLKTPPHMVTTEAMALIAGRQAYETFFLEKRIKIDPEVNKILKATKQSSTRRQLIFSRWVMVMVNFEAQLYSNPEQDLNELWWSLVEKYQKIKRPSGRENQNDWCSKYHIALAPVYYHSYLLGEMFASMILDKIEADSGNREMEGKVEVGNLLKSKLFAPGSSLTWRELVVNVVGKEIAPDSWIKEFAS
jgi:peptidyl-dipeptidase A